MRAGLFCFISKGYRVLSAHDPSSARRVVDRPAGTKNQRSGRRTGSGTELTGSHTGYYRPIRDSRIDIWGSRRGRVLMVTRSSKQGAKSEERRGKREEGRGGSNRDQSPLLAQNFFALLYENFL